MVFNVIKNESYKIEFIANCDYLLEYKHKKGAYYAMKEIEQKFSQMSPSFHYKESVVSKVREIES
jgi:hypothetical protein